MRQHIPAFNQLQINLSANDCNAVVTPLRKAASYDQRNAVVTPLRKAASYEQRKKNLGNQTFRRRIST